MSRYTYISEPEYRNTLFPRQQRGTRFGRALFRPWVGVILLVLFVAGAWWFLWGSTFQLRYVIVQGNNYLRASDVRNGVMAYEQTKIFHLIPHTSYFSFSKRAAEHVLTQSLQKTRALASVSVTKHFPESVTVVLHERVPHLLYSNGGKTYLLDRQGVLAAEAGTGKKVDSSFPLLYDQTTRDVANGKKVVTPRLVEFLFSVQLSLHENTTIPIDFFFLPALTCPLPVSTPEIINTNAVNTNSPHSTSGNTNTIPQEGSDASTTPLDANDNSAEPVCDLAALVLKNTELRVHTKEGWDIYFRDDDSVAHQVTRLVRVLREKSLTTKTLSYIDLRFGDQVVYK